MPALTLDNELGALVVSRDNARSCIPYAEIEQFSICDRVSSDSDGDKNHTYYIYVQCKDMSKWFLTDAHTYDIANEMLNKVKSHCDLPIPFTGSDFIAAKPALQQAHPPDKFMVTWSNRIKARPIRLSTHWYNNPLVVSFHDEETLEVYFDQACPAERLQIANQLRNFQLESTNIT